MSNSKSKKSFVLIMIVYLAGIFMGAIDTGIVSPAREIIQNNFMVDGKTGIWMITIYTLAYAASIPVMGKLADRIGRKTIYMVSIFLFGLGSLLCGLSHYFGSFEFLIGARALQAIGGGGIVPIATAEFGTSFPQEKRGMALGLVGAVYGIANIFGSLAGSAILDLFGTSNWQYIFFVNIPITIFIIIVGLIVLPNNKDAEPKRIDVVGILVITAMVLSLLYGLKNIDFFNFSATFASTSVYPFLIAFVVLLPVFILVEKKAQDPVINLRYFTKLRIVVTLVVAFIVGFILMGIVFIPQFAENALKVPAGRGGYFTVILALLSGVSAMLSGRLLDKRGAKFVMFLGFVVTIFGALFLLLVTLPSPSTWNVVASLMLLGFGLGFTLGAPINYMMLDNISDKEAGSGLATLSLIRSIGTTIAPALMVGFIAHAGMSLQTNIMTLLPNEIRVQGLPYVQEISDGIDKLKKNPEMAAKLEGFELPDLASLQTVKLDFSNMGSSVTIPEDLLNKFKTSDVTTITPITKEFASSMFSQMSPQLTGKIQGGIKRGIDGISAGLAELESSITEMERRMIPIPDGMASAKEEMTTRIRQMQALYDAIPGAFKTAEATYLTEIDSRRALLESTYQATLNGGYKSIYLIVTISAVAGMAFLALYRKKTTGTPTDMNGGLS